MTGKLNICNYFSDVPNIGGHLSKILTAQSCQEKETETLTTNTYQLLQHYNDIVSCLDSFIYGGKNQRILKVSVLGETNFSSPE